MNKEQVSLLAGQLHRIGFKEMETALLKRICFRLPAFLIQRSVIRTDDLFVFDLYFKKAEHADQYELHYYDVQLQKMQVTETDRLPVDLRALDEQMSKMQWKKFSNEEDDCNWEEAIMAERICEQLATLASSPDGKMAAAQLQLKYWLGKLSGEFYPSITLTKQKAPISQRFYFSGEQTISIDEACRFLQNKWVERQIQRAKQISKVLQVSAEKKEPKRSIKRKDKSQV